MNIRLEMDNWIINDEYIITNGVIGYEVYKSGTEDTEAEEVYSSESFEECLTWVWNSLQKGWLIYMRLHLFWLDKNWKKRGDCANNYNLIVDMENKTYKVYTNAFYGYYHPEDIEVKKKSDIEDYIEYLKRNGFREME